MLAISRRPGQAIFVYPSEELDPNMTVAELFAGGPIKIMTDIKNGQVKVGIAAPRQLTVLREELARDLLRLNGSATVRPAKDGEPGGGQAGGAELGLDASDGGAYDPRKRVAR